MIPKQPLCYNSFMRASAILCLLSLSVAVPFLASAADITTAAELDRIVFGEKLTNRTFRLTASVAATCAPPSRTSLFLQDASGSTYVHLEEPFDGTVLSPGEIVEVSGISSFSDHVYSKCLSLKKLGLEALPKANLVTSAEIQAGKCLRKRIRVEGIVRDAFIDEFDPANLFLAICDECGISYASLKTEPPTDLPLAKIIGRRISVTGVCTGTSRHPRPQMQHLIGVSSPDDIAFFENASDTPFQSPPVEGLRQKHPNDLLHLGRHRTSGRVIAVWNINTLLLETFSGMLVRADLEQGQNPPPCGSFAEIEGLPETDFIRINLSHALYRLIDRPADHTRAKPESMSVSKLTGQATDRPKFDYSYFGKPVRIHGQVVSISNARSERQIHLSDGGALIRIDVATHPELLEKAKIGYELEVCGTFVIDTSNYNFSTPFPRITDCAIVPWTCEDIVILKTPSWWTSARLFALLGAVSLILVAIVIWNLILRRLVDRRGRELAAETVARTESELKVYERTRLATELHDSLAQILTGVAFKLETADRLAETNPTAMRQHLGIAIRSLQTCRDDLRNCLWDLRNHALEIPDMDRAIRRTLEQHLGETSLAIRFNVPRERFSDNTTHEILCIIRELVLNAIRHGRATEIRVAGAIEDDILRFSVSDNGCGFDLDRVPGMREGHYGLQGVRERAAHLNGDFQIRPNGPAGMKAIVSIKIPHTS